MEISAREPPSSPDPPSLPSIDAIRTSFPQDNEDWIEDDEDVITPMTTPSNNKKLSRDSSLKSKGSARPPKKKFSNTPQSPNRIRKGSENSGIICIIYIYICSDQLTHKL